MQFWVQIKTCEAENVVPVAAQMDSLYSIWYAYSNNILSVYQSPCTVEYVWNVESEYYHGMLYNWYFD